MDDNPDFTFSPPEWVEEAGSTNDLLRERLAAGADLPAGAVLAARRQTRGKGRLGNAWQQASGLDLAFSFHWKGRVGLEAAGTLPMACALGVADFLASPGLGVAARCKWPNDVLAGGAKICGILTEARTGRDGTLGLVVGVGVNLGADTCRDAKAGRAIASIEALTGIRLHPEEALRRLLPRLAARITAWNRDGFAAVRKDFVARLWGIGQTATARTGGGRITGTILGLGENGELLLRGPDGGEMAVASAAALDM